MRRTLAWVRLAKSDNATALRRVGKRRSKHALNSIHKSCKSQNNWFKCDRLGKCHKNTYSPIWQTLFSPLTSMCCTKTISPPEMTSYWKSLLTPHRSMMEMCCSCFMDTKYKCLRCTHKMAFNSKSTPTVTPCVFLSRYPESLFKLFLAVSGPYVGKPTNIALEAAARPTQDRGSIVVC